MKRRSFTLIELLAAIAVIAILAGISMAGVSSAVKRARITQARSDVRNLAAAIKAYDAAYGRLPITLSTSASAPSDATPVDDSADEDNNAYWGAAKTEEYDLLMLTLSGLTIDPDEYKPVSDDSEKNKAMGMNPKRTPFMEFSQKFLEEGFRDPWGNRYVIVWNDRLNPYGIDFKAGTNGTAFRLRGNVFVYSLGPDRVDNGGVKNSDDVNSWD